MEMALTKLFGNHAVKLEANPFYEEFVLILISLELTIQLVAMEIV